VRHSAGSHLLRNGMPLQKVQPLLGHADSRLTSRIYAHLEGEDLRDAVRTMERVATGVVAQRDAS
jgi:site-specific recombinase XerD